MKRIFLAVAAMLAALACPAENLVMNGDFSKADEKGLPESWSKAAAAHGLNPGVDGKVYMSAPSSLCLTADSRFRQIVKLEPGTDYLFKCSYKSENVVKRDGVKSSVGGSCITLAAVDANGKMVKWIGSNMYKFRGTTDWEIYERTVKASDIPNGCSLMISLACESTVLDSKAYFDNISLEPVSSGIGNVLFFPVDRQHYSYWVCEGTPGLLRLDFTGDGQALVRNGVTLALELPEGVSLLGLNHMRPPAFFAEKSVNRKVPEKLAEKGAVRFEVKYPDSALKEMRTNLKVFGSGFSYAWSNWVYVIIDPATGSAGKSGTAYIEIKSCGKTLYSTKFTLTVLPPLRLPEHPVKILKAGFWRAHVPITNFEKVREKYLEFWKSVAEESLTESQSIEFLREKNPEAFKAFGFIAHEEGSGSSGLPIVMRQSKVFQGKKAPPFVEKDGKVNDPNDVAPWYVNEDPDGLIWSWMRDYYKKNKFEKTEKRIDYILDNFEPQPDSGYDTENLNRFAKFAGLSRTPSRETVRATYAEQWKQFRFRQFAERVRRYSDMVHRNFPGVKYIICIEPIRKGGISRLIDPRLFDSFADIHLPMFFFSGVEYYDLLEVNRRLLKSQKWVIQDPTEWVPPFYERYTARELERNVVAAAALGYKAVMYHPNDTFDGRYMQSVADGFSKVQKLENFYSRPNSGFDYILEPVNVVSRIYHDGEKSVKSLFPNTDEFLRSVSHTAANGEKLITVFNFSKKDNLILKLKAADGRKIREFSTGTFYKDADLQKGALISVPAETTGYFLVGEPDRTGKIVLQAELEKQASIDRKRLEAEDRFKASIRGNVSITAVIFPENSGQLAMKLAQGPGSIYLAQTGGDVIGWFRDAVSADVMLSGQTRGYLGGLFFSDTTQDVPPPYPFLLKNNGYDVENNPYVEFEYTVKQYDSASPVMNPLKDLRCAKTMTLKKNGRRLDVKYVFTNTAADGRNIPLSFRIKNYPMFGTSLAGGSTLSAITTVTGPKNANLLARVSGDGVYLKPGSENSFASRLRGVAAEVFAPGNLKIVVSKNGKTEEAILSVDWTVFAGLYVWQKQFYTLELLSNDSILAPGKSRTFVYSIEI